MFVPIQFCLDIFRELEEVTNRKVEAILLHPVYRELKKVSKSRGAKGRCAEMALRYVDKLKILKVEEEPGETVDDTILRLAVEWKCAVATNDRALRKKLREMQVAVIYLRQKSHLTIEGNIKTV